jgi:hypothetical protein
MIKARAVTILRSKVIVICVVDRQKGKTSVPPQPLLVALGYDQRAREAPPGTEVGTQVVVGR